MPSLRYRSSGWPMQKPSAGFQIDWGDEFAWGLAACWPFWEGSGNLLADIVGGRHAVLNNPASLLYTWSGERYVASAFDPVDRYSAGVARTLKRASTTNTDRFLFSPALTLAATERYTIECVFAHVASSGVLIDDDANGGFRVGSGGSVVLGAATSSNLTVQKGGLQHVMVTHDPDFAQIRYYVNGRPGGTESYTTALSLTALMSNAVSNRLNGQNALVRVWRGRVFTPVEAFEIMRAPWRMFYPSEASLRTFAPIYALDVTMLSPAESVAGLSETWTVQLESGGTLPGGSPVEFLSALSTPQIAPIDSDGYKTRVADLSAPVEALLRLRRAFLGQVDAEGSELLTAFFDVFGSDYSPLPARFAILSTVPAQDKLPIEFDVLEAQNETTPTFDIVSANLTDAFARDVHAPVAQGLLS